MLQNHQMKLIIALIGLMILLTACGNPKLTQGEFRDNYYELRDQGVVLCREKSFDYVGLEMFTFEQGQVICESLSPKKIYRYEVKIK